VRIVILAAGRLKDDIEQAHFRRYAALFDGAARGLRMPPLQMIEFAESRAPTAERRKADEARDFASRITPGARTMALDAGGELLTSPALAALLQHHREAATPALIFAVGGPDGHDATLLSAATAKLSLGRITLPHGLARIVLAEQLYRALTILAGHPYHRA
jgi:23S rRNA (pseudouridine1915-N3)-methyltransferase